MWKFCPDNVIFMSAWYNVLCNFMPFFMVCLSFVLIQSVVIQRVFAIISIFCKTYFSTNTRIKKVLCWIKCESSFAKNNFIIMPNRCFRYFIKYFIETVIAMNTSSLTIYNFVIYLATEKKDAKSGIWTHTTHYDRFGTFIYKQVVVIPMGANCASLVADLILYRYIVI